MEVEMVVENESLETKNDFARHIHLRIDEEESVKMKDYAQSSK